MTAREIVRTGLILGGIWIVVSGAASIAASIVEFIQLSVQIPGGSSDLVWSIVIPIVASLLAFLLFALTPGLYVISRSRRWAANLTSGKESVDLDPSLALAVGLMILGVIWIVEGSLSLLISPMSFWRVSLSPDDVTLYPDALSSVAYALLRLTAGALVYRWGSRAVLHAA